MVQMLNELFSSQKKRSTCRLDKQFQTVARHKPYLTNDLKLLHAACTFGPPCSLDDDLTQLD